MQHWVDCVFEDLTADRLPLSDEAWGALQRISDIVRNGSEYYYRTSRLEEVAERIDMCESVEELARQMREAAMSFRFSNASIFVISSGRGGIPFRSRVCTSLPEKWLRRYQARSYQFVDPVLRAAAAYDTPRVVTSELNESPVVHSFWQDAEDHGAGTVSWVNTITGTDGSKLAVTFNSPDRVESVLNNVRTNGSDLIMISRIAAGSFIRLSRTTAVDDPDLTELELQFLYVLCLRGSADSTSSIETRYCSNLSLQSSILRKLGVDSLMQAAVIAINRGWFDDLPWKQDEVSHVGHNPNNMAFLLECSEDDYMGSDADV